MLQTSYIDEKSRARHSLQKASFNVSYQYHFFQVRFIWYPIHLIHIDSPSDCFSTIPCQQKPNESHWQAQSLSTSFPLQGLQACSVGPWALPTICTERRYGGATKQDYYTTRPQGNLGWGNQPLCKGFCKAFMFFSKRGKTKAANIALGACLNVQCLEIGRASSCMHECRSPLIYLQLKEFYLHGGCRW